MMTRRIFLRGSGMAMAGSGAVPFWLGRAAASTESGRRKVLIAIFQRGAADGLNVVVPFGEQRYYDLRPAIGIQRPGRQGQAAIDLDGHFGLHPSLQPLKDLWDKRMLAIVEATGSPDPSRSHFDAQDYMESGTPGMKRDGWLNRALPSEGPGGSPLRAIALSPTLPRTLQGEQPAIAINNLDQFRAPDDTASIVESMYANSPDKRLGAAGKDAFAAMRMIESLNRQQYTPAGGAQYGQFGPLGQSLQQIARLIKADAGVEAAFAEIGGWDHHQNESGQLFNVLRQYGGALSAFCTDMGDRMEDIVIVTMSEFGRTARENGDNGTDHGHGDVMFVIGGPVQGGKVYGKWPGLEEEQLYEKRDLAVTTDFRTVLSELVTAHLGTADLAEVFPGYTAVGPLGLLKGQSTKAALA
jgi:uncharacterized protein (DUF1501 family)